MYAVCSFLKNMPASLPERFYQTCTRPLPTLGQSETCENMPASLPERFSQTCTRPLPTCETCQHRFHKVSIKHAQVQGLFPRWAKAKHAKHASIASRTFLSNMLNSGQPRFQNIYRMCTRSLHTLSQSDQTIHRYITK